MGRETESQKLVNGSWGLGTWERDAEEVTASVQVLSEARHMLTRRGCAIALSEIPPNPIILQC